MGKTVTLVDFQFAPFLERMAASLMYYKGFQMRVAPGVKTDYPAVNRWFDAMETLPSYQLTKSDYYTHCWDLPPQLGGCVMEAGGVPYERAINGERTLDGTRGSWEWPLEPHLGGVEPDWTWAASNDAAAQREAVERVSANFDAIVRFAARGAGRKGMPPVSAPLADPNAVPSPAVEPSVSAILRIVCAALLDGSPEKQDAKMNEIAKTIVEDGGPEFAAGVVDSLAYMRDRVGVPRDMKLPAGTFEFKCLAVSESINICSFHLFPSKRNLISFSFTIDNCYFSATTASISQLVHRCNTGRWRSMRTPCDNIIILETNFNKIKVKKA